MEDSIAMITSLGVGITFLGTGLYMMFNDRKIKQQGRKTLATVIDVNEISTNDGVTYEKVIEFQGSQGERVVQTLDYSTSIKPKRVLPYKIPIYYLQQNHRYKIVLAKNTVKEIMRRVFIDWFHRVILFFFPYFWKY